jgi:hypothetical protein
VLHRGVLFSSGVIAGEALTAVALAAIAALGLSTLDLELSRQTAFRLSIFAAVGIVLSFIVFTKPQRDH